MTAIKPLAILTVLLPLAAFADPPAGDRVVRLSEPVAVTDTHEIFGSPLDPTTPSLSLGQLIGNSADYVGREVVIATMVTKVCQKKGCFFIATDGNAVARVTFKDYGFFIPTDSAGKHVLLAGVLQPSELTAEQAAHAAKDLGGESPARIAGISYQIVATAVAIPKS